MASEERRYQATYAAHESLNQAVLAGVKGYAVLEFGTDWCGHCQAAQPAIAAFFQTVAAGTALPHFKVEDGKGKKLGRLFRVKLWPTVIVLKDGEEIARVVRPTQDADLAALAQAVQGEC